MKRLIVLSFTFTFVATLGLAMANANPDEPKKAGTNIEVTKTADVAGEAGAGALVNPQAEAQQVDAASSKQGNGGPGTLGHGPGGMGRGPGGMGRGPGSRQGMREDMSTLHAMFGDRNKIRRTVTNLPNGAEALTESDDPAIAKLLQDHVPAMEARVVGNKPLPPMTFHPVFVELIKHAKDYALTHEDTKKGIKVRYTSDDPYVVMLVQEHAKLVSRFIKNGMEEIHKPYTIPKLDNLGQPASAPTNGKK